jgi:hypothetical protein
MCLRGQTMRFGLLLKLRARSQNRFRVLDVLVGRLVYFINKPEFDFKIASWNSSPSYYFWHTLPTRHTLSTWHMLLYSAHAAYSARAAPDT